MSEEVVVVVAGDNDGNFVLTKKQLLRCGVQSPIVRFRDGQQVLDFLFSMRDCLHERSYVLFLDVTMPKVSGLDVLSRLKEDVKLCEIPVLMLTTTGEPEVIAECCKLGCDGYFQNPLNHGHFAELVEKLNL